MSLEAWGDEPWDSNDAFSDRDLAAELAALRSFLDGTGEIDGLMFGDKRGTGAFWWRRYLDAIDHAVAALTRPPADPDNEGLAGVVKEALRGDYTDAGMEDAFFRWPEVERAILAALSTAPRAEADTARVEEREACAKVADAQAQRCREAVAACPKWSAAQGEWSRARDACLDTADAIRARTLSDGASNVDRG